MVVDDHRLDQCAVVVALVTHQGAGISHAVVEHQDTFVVVVRIVLVKGNKHVYGISSPDLDEL